MKKGLISILISIIVLSMFSVVNAATASINLGASSEEVKVGDVFTVTLIGTADNNIAGLQANLIYDTNKLEIQNKTVAEVFYDYNANSKNEIQLGTGSSTDISKLSKSVTLCTITFKVLDTAEIGDATIEVKDIVLAVVNSNQEQEEVNIANDSITMDIVKETSGEGTGEQEPNNPEGTGKEEQTPSDSENDKQENTGKDSTKLPQTGAETTSLIVASAFVVISIIFYVSYRRYKDI